MKHSIVLLLICWTTFHSCQFYQEDSRGDDPSQHQLMPEDDLQWTQEAELFNIAYGWKDSANIDSALYYFNLAANKSYAAENWSHTVFALNEIGWLFSNQGLNDSANHYFSEAYHLADSHLGKNDTLTWTTYSNLAESYSFLGKQDIALEMHSNVKEQRLRLLKEKDQRVAYTEREIAHCHYRAGNYAKAIHHYNIALTTYIHAKGEVNSDVAWCYQNMANCELSLGNKPQAVDQLQKAIDIREQLFEGEHEDIAWSLHEMGDIYYSLQSYDKAIDVLKQAYDMRLTLLGESHPLTIWTLRKIGYCYGSFAKGVPQKQLSYVLKALKAAEPYYGQDHLVLAYTYLNVGQAYSEMYIYHKALIYLKKALEIFRKVEGEASNTIGTIYDTIGYTYDNMGEEDKATSYYQRALDIWRKNLPEDHENIGTAFFHLGRSALDLNQYQEVIYYSNKAIDIWEKTLGKDHSRINMARGHIGLAHMENGDFETAEDIFLECLAKYHRTFGNKHSEISIYYIYLGDLSRKKGLYDEMIQYFQKALCASLYSFSDTNIYAQPDISSDFTAGFRHILSLKKKAEGFYLLYQKDKEILHLETSLQTYSLLRQWIQYLRSQYDLSEDKAFLIQTVKSSYRQGVKLATKLFRHTDDPKYLEIAFSFFQDNKSIVLNELQLSEKALQFANVPDSIRAKESEIKKELNTLLVSLKDKEMTDKDTDEQIIAELRQKVFDKQEEWNNVLNLLENTYPAYFEFKYQYHHSSINDVQTYIKERPGSLFVEYFEGDSAWYMLGINDAEANMYTFPKDSIFKELMEEFLGEVGNVNEAIKNGHSPKEISQFSQTAFQLYQYLLQPVLTHYDQTKEIILIPDGMLGYLPFEILVMLEEEIRPDLRYGELAYLLNQYTVRYAYSSHSLLGDKLVPKNATKNYAGFAPAYTEGEAIPNSWDLSKLYAQTRGRLGPLLHNQDEIKNVAESIYGKAVLGQNATETIFKELAEDYKIIHLAMHTTINDEEPLLSGLVFARNDTANDAVQDTLLWINEEVSQDDGYLRALEIYNLSLKAELAVLSACHTGVGKLKHGEGIMSLGRAFAYAGCPNLVMSLWQADDAVTSKIIQNFFSFIRKGLGKDEALREARLAYLKENPPLDHPFYWASFILVGDDQPIMLNHSNRILTGFMLLVVFVFGCLSIYKYKSDKD